MVLMDRSAISFPSLLFKKSILISFAIVFLFAVWLTVVVGPPVSEKPAGVVVDDDEANSTEEESLGLEYERYMREVVKLLESDEEFRKKLESANSSDIKSGAIAQHLNFVSKSIRSKLDELKRNELERLRTVLRLKGRLDKMRQAHPDSGDRLPPPALHELEKLFGHLDSSNQHSFETKDLVKLIKRTTDDLEDIDRRRREDFKRYEMEKEHLRREEMKGLPTEEREKKEKEHEEMEKKHREHPKVHHPGNEEQLKDVWEEGDGLERDDFNPRTFFYLHDTNSDGFLDPVELEALFQKELDKVYNENATEDDMMERYEEMNRMREHVMKEIDTNRDSVISLEEFVNSTQREEFKKDEEWDTLEDERQFTDEELAAFEKDLNERQHASDVTPPTTTLSMQQQQHDDQQQQHVDQQQQQQLQQHVDQQQQQHVDQQQQQQHVDQQQQQQDQKLHFEPQHQQPQHDQPKGVI